MHAIPRALVLATVLLFAPIPTYALPSSSSTSLSTSTESLPSLAVRKSKKSKSSGVKIKFDPINNHTRGEGNVLARARVGQSGLTCKLKIKYYGDESEDSPDDIVSDADGVCSMHFDIPKRKEVVGDAAATLKVTDSHGRSQGEAKVSFDVRD